MTAPNNKYPPNQPPSRSHSAVRTIGRPIFLPSPVVAEDEARGISGIFREPSGCVKTNGPNGNFRCECLHTGSGVDLSFRTRLTTLLSRYLAQPLSHYELRCRNDGELLKSAVQKGDVLLVEGDQRVSAVIKYLTQSSWSHAVLYIGDELLRGDEETKRRAIEMFGDQAGHLIVEALTEGVVVSPLVKYIDVNIRICRPHRLRGEHLKIIMADAIESIGLRYDVRNILDLAVHLIVVSILPGRHREEILRLGSGVSSQVICTSLLGRLFHKIGFPVQPTVTYPDDALLGSSTERRSLWSLVARKPPAPYSGLYRRRHATVLTPRDFDLSPFFRIVKFNVLPQRSFDYSRIEWATDLARDELELDQPKEEEVE